MALTTLDGTIPRFTPRRHCLGGSMLLIFLLIMGAILIVGKILVSRAREESRGHMRAAMSDPKIDLERFFAERWREQSPSRDEWKRLLDFMSREDLAWLETNRETLARLALTRYGGSPATDEDRQHYDALRLLLGFGNQAVRPVVSSIRVSGFNAIAYVHPPRRIDQLQEIALVQEGGLWKIRRFLGERDSRQVMDAIVEYKRMQSAPMTEDEQLYLADPAAYPGLIRRHLLAEVGLEP